MSSLLIRKSFLIISSLYQLYFQYSFQDFPIVYQYSQEGCCTLFHHLYQFLYKNYHSITKKSRAISCHSLFPAWKCKRTWLLLSFVPTIGFTSSQFPTYEKQQRNNSKIEQLFFERTVNQNISCRDLFYNQSLDFMEKSALRQSFDTQFISIFYFQFYSNSRKFVHGQNV